MRDLVEYLGHVVDAPQDENPIETNWTPIEISIGFNWFQLVSIGFNKFQWDFNRTSDGFNWSRLAPLDKLAPLAPLA